MQPPSCAIGRGDEFNLVAPIVHFYYISTGGANGRCSQTVYFANERGVGVEQQKKLKVLIIPTWYPSQYDALMGIYHIHFAAALNSTGKARADLLHIQRCRLRKPLSYLFEKKYFEQTREGVNAYIYRMLNVAPVSFEWQLRRYVKKLDRAFCSYVERFGKPDILNPQVVVPAGYAALKLGEKYGIPVVMSEHGFFGTAMADARKPYAEYTLKNCVCTTVSANQLPLYAQFGCDCRLLPDTVDCAAYSGVEKQPDADGTLRLTTVCALREGKRVDDIAAALKLLLQGGQVKRGVLNIVGDGFIEQQYRDAVERMGMSQHVRFLGRMQPQEIARVFAKTDIYVCSSERESFYIPALDALAAGLPVVSTRCGGPQDYLDEGCGSLCNVGDPQDMARAVTEVWQKIESFDIKHLKSAAQRYSRENVAAGALETFEYAIKKYFES